jgi:hypothetical protein
MTEILTVDPIARLEAVRRHLAKHRRKRILLDLPDEWTELDNAARMRLLQRQAQIQQCELGLVTRNEATRKAAQQVGVPVFHRVEDAEGRAWRMHSDLPPVDLRRPAAGLPDPPPWRRGDLVANMARPTLHHARQARIRSEARYRQPLPLWLRLVGYGMMGALMILLVGGFGVYVLPAATVTLVPGQAPISTQVQLTANPDIDTPDLDINLLPGRLVETSLELTGTIRTSGVSQRPTDKASGTVIFVNSGNTAVSIPVGTVVSTATGTPVLFRTVAAAELASGVGQRVSVPIEAVEPGTIGNVRANTISVVEGPLRFRVTVLNPNGTFGGGSQLAPTVTQADRDNLLAQLQEQTEARAVETLQQELQPGEWLPAETVKTFVIAQAFTAFNDEEAEELGLTLRTLIQGVAVNEATTREVMLAALQRTIPPRGKLVADTFQMQRIPGAVAIDRSVQFTVAVSGNYVVPIDPNEVRAAVSGLPPDEAASILQSRWNIARPPDIYLDPPWMNTMPRLGRRIQVRVEYAEAGVTP